MMERRAKERLIGASILVVLIVLVVPELLSGPKPTASAPQTQRLPAAASAPEPIRNVTVDLATSKAPTTAETDSASAPPAAPEATLQPASAATVPAPEPESEAPATAAGAPSAAPAPPAVGGPADRGPAVRGPPVSGPPVSGPLVSGPLDSQASSPISKAGSAHGEVSRSSSWSVQLGSFASRANADNLVHRLKAQGFAAYILTGGSGAATRHRVRVGPLADRGTAERSAAKLKTLGHSSSLVAPGA
jgi:DedD protein